MRMSYLGEVVMSDTVGSVVFLVVLVGVIYLIVRAAKGGSDIGSSDAFESADPKVAKLYKIADSLNAVSSVLARPADLSKHDAFAKGTALLSDGSQSDDDLLAYGTGGNMALACLAFAVLKSRPAEAPVRERVIACLGDLGFWPYSFALDYILSSTPPDDPVIGRVAAETADDLWDSQVKSTLAGFIEARLAAGETPVLETAFKDLSEYELGEVKDVFSSLPSEAGRALADQVPSTQAPQHAPEFLDTIGTVWKDVDLKDVQDLIEHENLGEVLQRLETEFCSDPPRSSLIIGEAGVGKSAAILRLAARLYKNDWTIFVAGHAELIAGQVYIGQFEERLRGLTEFLRSKPRILWIIPRFEALAFSGRHHYSPVSALDTLLPLIEHGEIHVVGEVSGAAYEQLALTQPRVLSALGAHRIEPLSAKATRELGRQWLSNRNVDMAPEVLAEAAQLAQHYLGDSKAPGNLMKLLSLTLQRMERIGRAGSNSAVELQDVIVTLTELSGLPSSILDDRQALDLEALRRHFHQHVVGQDEAVGCLVERVAMIKAGLTDPTRPSGVFLFAGPTGTGKTEIAKTLSEWLFGSANRMIRIDMSELQTPESLSRLIGSDGPDSSASLADQVRKQPFSVILLDEFEKAYPFVWDLFLQVFDDGRLTDQHGRVVDFRHTIVILTSNLGATIPSGTPMGFGSQSDGFDSDAVHRAIEATFRKEFINRIDRVVVFQPLTRDVMRQILQIEIDSAFRRRGLRSRSWAVEWDESAIGFLLDIGFRPDLGARPLKRALDRFLLAPLAVTIVNHQVPAGDQFLFISRKGDALDVEFVDPNAEGEIKQEAAAPPDAGGGDLSLKSVVFQAKGNRAELEFLLSAHDRLSGLTKSDDWQNERNTNLSMLELPEFWQSEERFEILGIAEIMDRIDAALRGAGSLLRRLSQGGGQDRDSFPAHVLTTAAQSLYLVEIAVSDVRSKQPADAFIMVDSSQGDVAENAISTRFGRQVSDMYLGWAKKRRMKFKVLGGGREKAADGRFVMAVGGFGAYSILRRDAGLHVLEMPDQDGNKNKRATVNVRVAPQPLDVPMTDAKSLRKVAEAAFANGGARNRKIVRRYRERPSPLVRDVVREWRTGRFDRVMDGDFDVIE